MSDEVRESTAQAVRLPPKSFLSEDELLEIWETRGLKFRFDEFYHYCCDRGLLSHFKIDSFRGKAFRMLQQFFVEGETRRDPRSIPAPKRRNVY